MIPGSVLCAYPTGSPSPLAATGWALRTLDPAAVFPDGWGLAPGAGGDGSVSASAGLLVVPGRPLGPGPVSVLTLMATGLAVMGGLELSGSDGCPTGVVTGPRLVPAAGLNLSLIGLLLDVGGQQLATACGASAAGHPVAAATAALSGRRASHLEAGAVEPGVLDADQLGAGTMIFSGRWTAPVPVPAGSHLTASFGHLGSVTLRVGR